MNIEISSKFHGVKVRIVYDGNKKSITFSRPSIDIEDFESLWEMISEVLDELKSRPCVMSVESSIKINQVIEHKTHQGLPIWSCKLVGGKKDYHTLKNILDHLKIPSNRKLIPWHPGPGESWND